MRLLLYIILFYLLYRLAKNVIGSLFAPRSDAKVKGTPQKPVKTFDPNDIEDIEYKEVKKDHER